jgi:site-specific DNA-methyltransferase (adenine-specific)
MAALPDASVDAVVTDPPYGLSFMGKRWDYDVPGVDVWQQVLRVLKPGGHLLAFAGTRTQHRMAVRIEDAGFEIRDMIAWVYGSGFPKSLDVSKAIDKAAGAERELGPKRVSADGTVAHDRAGARHEGYERPWRSDPDAVDRNTRISYPATPEARQWSGWGTALKPALEPITVARKPLIGTVAQNVLEHGTGALNIDGCRVGRDAEDVSGWSQSGSKASDNRSMSGGNYAREAKPDAAGRWPANLIHDGSDEVVGLFPETDEEQSAARFFYTAKADKSDRGHGNNHPTVKPVDLMRYLVRLVCPMDGIVLDPFNGSGTTAVASRAEHCRYIGAELNEDYCRITVERLAQGVLF